MKVIIALIRDSLPLKLEAVQDKNISVSKNHKQNLAFIKERFSAAGKKDSEKRGN
jgi:hypothetical protein